MLKELQLTVLLIVAGVALVVQLALQGVRPSTTWVDYLPHVVSTCLLAIWLFDRWLWRLPFLPPAFVNRPYIAGTWRMVLRSNWKDPETGRTITPIDGYMVVRQTYSALSLRLLTEESSSEVLAADLLCAADNTFRVAGIYTNEPRANVRHRSEIHHGGLLLQVQGDPPTSLEGHYWTDRGTMGDVRLSHRDSRLLWSYSAARSRLK